MQLKDTKLTPLKFVATLSNNSNCSQVLDSQDSFFALFIYNPLTSTMRAQYTSAEYEGMITTKFNLIQTLQLLMQHITSLLHRRHEAK